jgi:ABC-type Fe3+ transport system substrate-binding protein
MTVKRILLVATALAAASVAQAADKLVILSPHRKSIQDEFVPAFKEHYKKTFNSEVEVDWLDQGGSSNNARFLRSKFEKNPKAAEVDVFWGGGTPLFVEFHKDKLLEPYELPSNLKAEIPQDVAGVPLYDASKTWYASALSSFGIFYNKKIVKMDGLPEPKKWDDLADPKFFNQLTLADPRQSGTANAMDVVVLQALGWDKGWELLARVAGNTRKFTHSSSDPIKAVVSGDAAASMAVDFYAQPKVDEIGEANLAFMLPEGQTVLDADPIAIVKGTQNRQTAERFLSFVLSKEGQKLLILPKGAEGGPKLGALGRMSVNTAAYKETEGKRASKLNPFELKSLLKMDLDKASKMQRPFNDLIGAIQIDVHEDLKKAWQAVIKRGAKPEEIAALAKPPVTEAELIALNDKWEDEVLRNRTINAWVEQAKAKYKKLAEGAG